MRSRCSIASSPAAQRRRGAAAALKTKALQLTGGPSSPPPPADRNVYGALVASGQADVFITYCTNAVTARKEEPQLQVLAVPDAINVWASYGLALMQSASAAARPFIEFVLGPAGQKRLAEFGFIALP
jgi:molybdate transport system substrate-binding protein